MKLSEAIRTGRTFRPESHQGDPFVRIANLDDLASDVWGAAVEAVHSLIAKRNWTAETRDADMAYFCDIQMRYFAEYFRMAAVCPGVSAGSYAEAGGRMTGDKRGSYVIEGEHLKSIGAVTSECRTVAHLAGFVEHAFYAHNWTSDQVADAVQWYEEQQSILIAQNFEHYQSEELRRIIAQRVTAEARQREIARHYRSNGNRTYVH